MMVWRWFDCSRILFRGLSLLGISRGKAIQTLTLNLYMRIQRIKVSAAAHQFKLRLRSVANAVQIVFCQLL